jgi:Protein of unknown function (DUF3040)
MSLAPAERRALARIEDSLCRSDPRLARMLTRFRVPITRGGWKVLARRPRQLRLFVPLILTVTIFLCVLAIVLGPHHAVPSRGADSGPGSVIAATRINNCPAASHKGGVATNSQVWWPSGNQNASWLRQDMTVSGGGDGEARSAIAQRDDSPVGRAWSQARSGHPDTVTSAARHDPGAVTVRAWPARTPAGRSRAGGSTGLSGQVPAPH